jgi:hypothetical protein
MRFGVFILLFTGLGIGLIQAMYMGTVHPPESESYEPIYMSWKDLRSSIKSEPSKAIAKRGKIGIRGDYLFINEPNAGIHVFDNRDPSSPKSVAFLKIPGNVDLAVKGDVLFADSFVDLVALDISALPEVKELNRQVDVFPYDAHQVTEDGIWYYGHVDKTKGVVVGWKQTRGSK